MKRQIIRILFTILIWFTNFVLQAQSTEPIGEGDRDADGILDKDDVCPDLVGPKSNNGCPEENALTEALQKLNRFFLSYQSGYYKNAEIVDGYLKINLGSNNYDKCKVDDLILAEVKANPYKVLITCKNKKKGIYSSYENASSSYMEFTTYKKKAEKI